MELQCDLIDNGEDAIEMCPIFKHKLWTSMTLKEAGDEEPMETTHIGACKILVPRAADEMKELRKKTATKYSRSRSPMRALDTPVSPTRKSQVMTPTRAYSTTLSPGDRKSGFTMGFRNQNSYTRGPCQRQG